MLETIVVLSEGNPANVKQRKPKQRKCHPFMMLILVVQTTFRFLGLNNTAGKNIFEEAK